MKNKSHGKRGFTLIELLVVVLIIGILAAIALPKYKRAVIKARMTEVLMAVKAIADAQESYYLLHGVYSDTFGKLDITLPYENLESNSMRENLYLKNNATIILVKEDGFTKGSCFGVAGSLATKSDGSESVTITNRKGKDLLTYCYTKTSNPTGMEMCKLFGPQIPCEPCVIGGTFFCTRME